jgi:putative RNA 2'-phosphotransferase
MSEFVQISKVLSKVLRHEPDLIGIRLDGQGWVEVDVLIQALNKARTYAEKRLRTLPVITRELLEQVVAQNDKQRYAFSPDGQKLRAVQGHSVSVDLGYEPSNPPEFLYHGTASRVVSAILKEGLHAGNRHAVHLSENKDLARTVGARHGTPVVLVVRSGDMASAGFKFYRADNGTWLTDKVPPKYLSLA